MKFGELAVMAIGRIKQQWDHTAPIIAHLINPYRDAKHHPEPFAAADFHPFQDSKLKRRSAETYDITILKKHFCS